MQWVLKNISEEQRKHKQELCEKLNVSDTLAHLLVLRGISNFDEAKKFFRPSLDDLHSPFLMDGMEKAVYRLNQAIQNKEKILIYGDYDVDGTTAVSSMYLFLQQFIDVHLLDYYVPDRFDEGYGVSEKGIQYAKENGFTLMIILDCGIKEVEKINDAQSIGIDCIICDHHTPPDIIPNAYAVLNPKKVNCNYPYKELTGCGIGFKLMQAYCIQNNIDKQHYLNYLDYVATSIAADIVPIDGENRVLTYYGLKKINDNPSIGIKKLLEVAFYTRKREIKTSDLVFVLAPRINAPGRIEHGSIAIKLLTSTQETEAEKWAKQLDELNKQRQELHKQTVEEAIQIIDDNEKYTHCKTTVVFKNDWNKGVVGIVASKLVERYYKPTIVLTEHNGYITGSARSVDGFDLYLALMECKDYLYQFGGHKYAAGLSIEKENLNNFIQAFERVVQSNITEEQQIKKLYVDAPLFLNDINEKFLRILQQFEPHGPSNMTPLFWIKNVKDSGRMYETGNGHLKMNLIQDNLKEHPAIFYNGIEWFDKIKGKSFDCACKIWINEMQENNLLYTLIIEDIKIQ